MATNHGPRVSRGQAELPLTSQRVHRALRHLVRLAVEFEYAEVAKRAAAAGAPLSDWARINARTWELAGTNEQLPRIVGAILSDQEKYDGYRAAALVADEAGPDGLVDDLAAIRDEWTRGHLQHIPFEAVALHVGSWLSVVPSPEALRGFQIAMTERDLKKVKAALVPLKGALVRSKREAVLGGLAAFIGLSSSNLDEVVRSRSGARPRGRLKTMDDLEAFSTKGRPHPDDVFDYAVRAAGVPDAIVALVGQVRGALRRLARSALPLMSEDDQRVSTENPFALETGALWWKFFEERTFGNPRRPLEPELVSELKAIADDLPSQPMVVPPRERIGHVARSVVDLTGISAEAAEMGRKALWQYLEERWARVATKGTAPVDDELDVPPRA